MALQHIRSSTLDKRPQPASLSDGQLAINTNVNAPGVFFKDSNGTLVKVGPTFVGTTAPNSTPGSGGASGNTLGEQWLDTSGTNPVLKIWDGSAWQSEAGEFVNVSGDTMTGALVMDNQQQIRFRETTANGTNYIALQAPASVAFDKTITLPDVTGTVVTTGDTGSVTSTMIADGTIVNADVNASAAIAGTKIDPDFGSQTVETTGVFSAAGGAEATPSITFTGDLNTGIYSPGADQLAISSNSSERIRIGANGEIGIGGANYGTSGQVLTSGGSGAAPSWTTITATTDKIEEGNTSAEVIDTGSDGRFVITTEGVEALRVDSSQRVGIGTTAFPASTPIQVKAVGAGAGGYAIVSANDENAGGIILNSSSDNSVRIEADPGNLRASSYINLSVDGSERARIDSSGRLLVGTSTSASAGGPQYAKLQVVGNTLNETSLLSLQRNEAFGNITSGEDLGVVLFADNTGNTFAQIAGTCDGTTGAGDFPGRLVFSTTSNGASSPTERMRITNDGLIYAYSVDAGYIQGVSNGAGTTYRLFAGRHSSTGADGSGTESYRVWSNGNVENTNNSYGAISDAKLKENIVDASSQWTDLKALQVRNYNFKEGQTHTQIGLIAQEVELVSPGLVSESPDRDEEGNDLGTVTKSVNYSVLYMKAVKALQEAMERIETLEAKVAALESV